MSISPFESKDRPRLQRQLVEKQLADQPLTLSQALIITAGMAGLIGLISGGLIRFSLTHSSNARFLSPLQTFPTSPDWTQDASEPDGGSLTPSPSVNSNSFDLGDDPTHYPKSFDEFASRSLSSPRTEQDPLEALRRGPLLRESGRVDSEGTAATIPELEDPAFEPYFDPETETERFYQ